MKEKLTKHEEKMFSKLKRKEFPSASLEKNIVNQLKSENLITSKTFKMNTTIKRLTAIAAAITLFFAGNYFGKKSASQPAIDPLLGYMLILHEDEKFNPGDPNVMYQEYYEWMQNTFKKGVNITGQELKNEAVFINNEAESPIKELGSENRTTGYFILEAKSRKTVLEIAKSNPHIKYGGSIEVKEYMVR